MTLIGFWIEIDRAFLFADTESYRRVDDDDSRHLRPGGHHLKIVLNERASMAAVGAGTRYGNMLIGDGAAFADSFDHLTDGLPTYLIGAKEDLESPPNWIGAAAGFSRRFGRMMGAVFQGPEFSATIMQRYSMPAMPEFGTLNPAEPGDILPYAQIQMREVQRSYPLAGVGIVTIAEVRRDSIEVTSFDLVTGRASQFLPNLPTMSSGKSAPTFSVEAA